MFQYALFDLDGTLTDPKEGITKCVQFALAQQGIREVDLNKLTPFIGPPLVDSFMEYYGLSREQALLATEDYRKRFSPIGIFENKVYPGIPQMLEKLKAAGMKLAVASSKPEAFVERILEHFSLRAYFDVVVGSNMDGTRVDKEEVVEEALRRLGRNVCHENCAMVGDRKFDVSGAKEHGLTAVAVAYGYALKGELTEAQPDFIARTVQELEAFLLGGDAAKSREEQKTAQENTTEENRPVTKRAGLNPICTLLTCCILAGTAAVGVNILFSLLGITSLSTSYEKTAQAQYAIPFWQGMLLYGVLSPLAEEALFRKFFYGWLRRYTKPLIAGIASAVLFGAYHGNLVQGIYGFLFGILFVYLYEVTGRFAAPFLAHASANCAVFAITYDESVGAVFADWTNCVFFLLFSALSFVNLQLQMKKQKK